jgi:DinB superfamily
MLQSRRLQAGSGAALDCPLPCETAPWETPAVDSGALRDEFLGLSDYVWQRLADRLVGLTDAEYLWEPVSGCWNIRPGPAGLWELDFIRPEPDPKPVTTIAWRLAHLTTDIRFRPWLGLEPRSERAQATVPLTAQTAVAAVLATMAERHEDLLEMTEVALWEPIGAIGGVFAESTRVAWVLHILDEVIHHGAEIALLRDLFCAKYVS